MCMYDLAVTTDDMQVHIKFKSLETVFEDLSLITILIFLTCGHGVLLKSAGYLPNCPKAAVIANHCSFSIASFT